MTTSAASGSSTMVLRKTVVKPKVSPKPGRLLGCRKLTWAPGERSSTGQRPPSSSARKRSVNCARCSIADDEHLRGTLGEAARELLLGVAEMQLGAHLQAVRGLRLRARIEQLAHALRVRRARGLGEHADVDRFGGHVPQHARRDRQRGAARRLPDPVDEHALRRRAPRPAAASRSRAPQRSSHSALRGAVGAGGDDGGADEGVSALAGGAGLPELRLGARARCGSPCARRARPASGWRLSASACCAEGAQAVKLDSGVGSTCTRRTPIATL